MNFYSATVDKFRRFAVGRRSARFNGKRTYVFILVPADAGRNGHAKRVEAIQLLDNAARFAKVRTESVRPSSIDPTDNCNLPDDSAELLNYDLMWTWFLPNPLWPPKERK
jgi:hypothetical protein